MESKLPKNWVETNLVSIVDKITNGANLNQNDIQFKNSFPITRIETIADESIDLKRVKYVVANEEQVQKYSLKKGDILFSHINSDKHLGKTAIFNLDDIVLHGINLLLIRCNKYYNPFLLNYFFKYYRFEGKFIEVAQRAVNQSSINQKKLNVFGFPLPPLAEQNRIVAKLDTLFAQLETIKTSMAKVPLLLKDFRQQVLTQAVTGKLTEEWRNGKDLEEWKFENAKECCEKVQSGGTPKGSNFALSGIPFLKVYNIVNNKIDFEYNPQYVSEEIQNGQIKKSITYPNDVVMNIVGPPLNKVAIIPNDYPEWNLNQAITLFRTKKYLSNKFLYYFFCEGSSVKSLVNETKGVVGQVNISLSQCRDFVIPIPSEQEQQEIVSRVESLFAKADAIEKQYETLKAKIESLPQALLHKAFKGELTEQLDTDGDASELLQQIQELKATKNNSVRVQNPD